MITGALARRADVLAAQSAPFVTATVVRAQRPTSVRAGNVALVLSDGTIEGFVGGVCAEHSVRVYSMRVLQTGESMLLRILPGQGDDEEDGPGQELAVEEGAVTVQNPCLSGGAIEIFLEPVLAPPRVLVSGATPIAGALERLGPELGFDMVVAHDGPVEPMPGDLGLIVAAHGRGELEAVRAGLEAGLPYVGLVASPVRGAALVEELRGEGMTDEQLQALEWPAGIEIGANTPAEIALSILARVIAVRRSDAYSPPPIVVGGSATAPNIGIDPICGMTVAGGPDTPQVVHEGETIYFCCEGCKTKFVKEHAHAVA